MFKNWVRYFFSIVLSILIFIIFFNYLVDPFQHYRKAKLYSFDYSGNQRYLNPGLAKNYDYNSIIIGTSMTENFTLDKTKQFLNNPIKLSIAGGTAFEIKQILDISLSVDKNVETIILGLDLYSFLGAVNNVSNGGLPDYLYDDNYFNDYKYLLNLDTFKRSYKLLLAPNNRKDKMYYNYNHMFEWQANYQKSFTIENVIKNWKNRNIKFNHKSDSWDLDHLENSFDNNLLKVIQENKNINFYIFFPPYSILTYKDWEEKKILETVLLFKRYIYNNLISLKNVKLYDFQIASEVTHNLENYKDITHYSQNINNWMLTEMINDKFLMNDSLIQDFEIEFRNQINQYIIEF